MEEIKVIKLCMSFFLGVQFVCPKINAQVS